MANVMPGNSDADTEPLEPAEVVGETPTDGPYFAIEAVTGPDESLQFQGNVYGANHELVWWTEAYKSFANAIAAIELLRNHAATAKVYIGPGVRARG